MTDYPNGQPSQRRSLEREVYVCPRYVARQVDPVRLTMEDAFNRRSPEAVSPGLLRPWFPADTPASELDLMPFPDGRRA